MFEAYAFYTYAFEAYTFWVYHQSEGWGRDRKIDREREGKMDREREK